MKGKVNLSSCQYSENIFIGRVYDIQGQKAIFLKKGFAEYSSVVVQFTKKINSIRDQIEANGGKAEATDVEIGQG